jgi:hypothetical protein
MLSFEKTSLWRRSFGNPEFEADQDAIRALRESLLNMRSRAEHCESQTQRTSTTAERQDFYVHCSEWIKARRLIGHSK